MNTFRISINGEDVTRFAIYPINLQFTLDVGLDQGFVELRNSKRTTAYPAFSLVSVTINNDTEPILYYISVDNCIVNQFTGRANHKILLIEETKILERVICRAKSFVKPLVRNYLEDNSAIATPTEYDTQDVIALYEADEDFYYSKINKPSYSNGDMYIYTSKTRVFQAKEIKAVYLPSERIYFSSIFEELNKDDPEVMTKGTFEVYSKFIELRDASTNKRIDYMNYHNQLAPDNDDPYITIPGNESYYIYVFANVLYRNPGAGSVVYVNFATQYQVASAQKLILTKPSDLCVTDTVNKLLEIAEPIRKHETSRFTFSEKDQTRFATTPCAEFNFANGATLWENLLEIARTVQCIPRLKNNVVYFDDLGGTEMLDTGVFGTPVSHVNDSTSEKFASHLDSVVNGLMNLDNEEQGAISDPFDNGFRTLRSETSVTDMRTTVNTAMITTVANIEKITKVTVNYKGSTYDITPYIYEKKEYDLLYSNQGSYPYAKAYALYYVQGQPNIYGLTYKEGDAITTALRDYAISLILKSVGANVSWESDMFDLSFNVEYISTINGRVRQAKRNVADLQTHSVIAFNQSANKLSSVNYGKRLKGEIAMMGSAETKLVFKAKGNAEKWAAIKTAAGKIYPDETYGKNMYISSVTAKMWRDYFLIELGLTKNFNQLGRHVGINSAVRQFEIDTNVSESYMVWEDYAVISVHNSQIPNQDIPLNNQSFSRDMTLEKSISQTIAGNPWDKYTRVTLAEVKTYDYSGAKIGTYLLPVQSVALGNSILFNFRFEDNYSAGSYLQDIGQDKYRLTRLARYGDPIYGEAYSMHVNFYCKTSVDSGSEIVVGDSLPLDTKSDKISKYCCLGSIVSQIVIHKSSRDAINFTYQLHLVTDDGYILGDALAQNNPLVGGTISNGVTCYLYNCRLNEITGEPEDEDKLVKTTTVVLFSDEWQGVDIVNPNTKEYKSWAIKDSTGKFLIGKNGMLPDDGWPTLELNSQISVKTTHKIPQIAETT